jgi:hypothetical protein
MAKRKVKTVTLPRNLATQATNTEIVVEVNPPGTPLGENMPVTPMKGYVPADEQPELIVWDKRQKEE